MKIGSSPLSRTQSPSNGDVEQLHQIRQLKKISSLSSFVFNDRDKDHEIPIEVGNREGNQSIVGEKQDNTEKNKIIRRISETSTVTASDMSGPNHENTYINSSFGSTCVNSEIKSTGVPSSQTIMKESKTVISDQGPSASFILFEQPVLNCPLSSYSFSSIFSCYGYISKEEGSTLLSFHETCQHDLDKRSKESSIERYSAKIVDSHGNEYDGQFHHAKKDGLGTIVYAETNDKYVGQWKDDQPHGEGKFSKVDQETSFEGRWDNGKLIAVKEGVASFTDSHGNHYDGHFKDWKKHGIGSLTSPNGERYSGSWVDGMKHGYGVMELLNSARFEGYFEADRATSDGSFYNVTRNNLASVSRHEEQRRLLSESRSIKPLLPDPSRDQRAYSSVATRRQSDESNRSSPQQECWAFCENSHKASQSSHSLSWAETFQSNQCQVQQGSGVRFETHDNRTGTWASNKDDSPGLLPRDGECNKQERNENDSGAEMKKPQGKEVAREDKKIGRTLKEEKKGDRKQRKTRRREKRIKGGNNEQKNAELRSDQVRFPIVTRESSSEDVRHEKIDQWTTTRQEINSEYDSSNSKSSDSFSTQRSENKRRFLHFFKGTTKKNSHDRSFSGSEKDSRDTNVTFAPQDEVREDDPTRRILSSFVAYNLGVDSLEFNDVDIR